MRFLQKNRISHLHAIGMKPVVFAGLMMALGVTPVRGSIATVTGLGAHGDRLQTARIRPLIRLSLRSFSRVVFQNSDDAQLFKQQRLVTRSQSRLIVGSGVDIRTFSPSPDKRDTNAPFRVVLISRLLKAKGIETFARIAARVQQQNPNVAFELYGDHDATHPDAVSTDWLHSSTQFTYKGPTNDVPNVLSSCDVFLFPSTYGEGVPRVVMEAASVGVPTVAFDVPGVREAVENGETGYLVAPGQEARMAQKVVEILQNSELRETLGAQARKLAVERFDIHKIVEQYLEEYRSVGLLNE